MSLADYVGRMQPGQERIYYVIGDSLAAARSSPHLEQLRAAGIEVLLLADRIDEWVMGQLREFEGKRFKDAARGELELGTLATPPTAGGARRSSRRARRCCERCKDALGERGAPKCARALRLQDSPVCLVRHEGEPSVQLRRVLEASGQHWPAAKPLLELNIGHPLVSYLDGLADATVFAELTRMLYEQALLTEDGTLADPGAFAQRLNGLLARLVGAGMGQ